MTLQEILRNLMQGYEAQLSQAKLEQERALGAIEAIGQIAKELTEAAGSTQATVTIDHEFGRGFGDAFDGLPRDASGDSRYQAGYLEGLRPHNQK